MYSVALTPNFHFGEGRSLKPCQDRQFSVYLLDLRSADDKSLLQLGIAALQEATKILPRAGGGGTTLTGTLLQATEEGVSGYSFNCGDSQTMCAVETEVIHLTETHKPESDLETPCNEFFLFSHGNLSHLVRKFVLGELRVCFASDQILISLYPTHESLLAKIVFKPGFDAEKRSETLKGILAHPAFRERLPPDELHFRVNQIAMSRAIADYEHPHIYREPTITKIPLIPTSQLPLYVIAGSDGLWDIMSPQVLFNTGKFREKADCLAGFALNSWRAARWIASDDTGIVCLKLGSAPSELPESPEKFKDFGIYLSGVADGHGKYGQLYAGLSAGFFQHVFPIYRMPHTSLDMEQAFVKLEEDLTRIVDSDFGGLLQMKEQIKKAILHLQLWMEVDVSPAVITTFFSVAASEADSVEPGLTA